MRISRICVHHQLSLKILLKSGFAILKSRVGNWPSYVVVLSKARRIARLPIGESLKATEQCVTKTQKFRLAYLSNDCAKTPGNKILPLNSEEVSHRVSSQWCLSVDF